MEGISKFFTDDNFLITWVLGSIAVILGSKLAILPEIDSRVSREFKEPYVRFIKYVVGLHSGTGKRLLIINKTKEILFGIKSFILVYLGYMLLSWLTSSLFNKEKHEIFVRLISSFVSLCIAYAIARYVISRRLNRKSIYYIIFSWILWVQVSILALVVTFGLSFYIDWKLFSNVSLPRFPAFAEIRTESFSDYGDITYAHILAYFPRGSQSKLDFKPITTLILPRIPKCDESVEKYFSDEVIDKRYVKVESEAKFECLFGSIRYGFYPLKFDMLKKNGSFQILYGLSLPNTNYGGLNFGITFKAYMAGEYFKYGDEQDNAIVNSYIGRFMLRKELLTDHNYITKSSFSSQISDPPASFIATLFVFGIITAAYVMNTAYISSVSLKRMVVKEGIADLENKPFSYIGKFLTSTLINFILLYTLGYFFLTYVIGAIL